MDFQQILGSIFDQFLNLFRERPKSLKYNKTNEKSTFSLPLGIIFPIKFRLKFWFLFWNSFLDIIFSIFGPTWAKMCDFGIPLAPSRGPKWRPKSPMLRKMLPKSERWLDKKYVLEPAGVPEAARGARRPHFS